LADNVIANAGAGGATFATDNKGGTEHWPITKVGYGTRDTNYNLVDDSDGNRLPTKPIGPIGAFTDAHAAIATGGLDQQLLAAATRKILMIWNPPTETELLYVNFGAAAAADNTSIPLEPGSMIEMQSPGFVSNEAVHVIAATAGHKVGCKWA